ncbi:hypothetical protein GO988_02360 [Hymenobacter sp. HMF4947]|uniref:Uncharacterized protein n=1 Tax=Hymenobacter ginkgonis TaxID=2682976 RepID=A0A7K1T9T5_9BACT|nr:hypothetical protein [Hymenobacter ginkgonis]MVN75163.1 hypothetical protein [Hymenobacter ginkgonis]
MRATLLLLILLLSGSSVFAQATPHPTPADSVALVAPAPDTVAAIHRLFAAKRKRNSHFFVGTVGVIAVGGVVIGTASSSWDGLAQAALGAVIIAFVGLPALTAETITALNYNKKSERQAVEDFQAHKVPRYLKRRLKPAYFQELPQSAPHGG